MYHLYRNDMLLMHTEDYLEAIMVGEELQRDGYDRIEIKDDKGRLLSRMAYCYEHCEDPEWRWKPGIHPVK